MLCRRIVVGGQQLGDGAEPHQPPAPADPLGEVVELAGGLGDVAEVQQRADLHQRQLDRLGEVDALGVQRAVPRRPQRIQRLHRLTQHRRRQHRRADVGGSTSGTGSALTISCAVSFSECTCPSR